MHRFSSRSAAFIGGILAALVSGCASSPANRRATAIAAADHDARQAIANEPKVDPSRIPARSIGVLPFSVAESDTLLRPLGYATADLLSTDLARSGELQIVERLRLDAIVRELDLAQKGLTDPATAPRVGRIMGARRLLIGNVRSAPGGQIEFSARLVDAVAGTVQPLVSARAPLDRVIDAEKELALRVFEAMGVTLTPSQRVAVEQRQTTNLQALVAYGRGLEAEARGDVATAMRSFADAARLDAAFIAARTQLSGATSGPSSAPRGSGVQRVLDISAQAINAPVPTKLPEVADVVISGQMLTLLLTVRIF
jgi:TolB-like protein